MDARHMLSQQGYILGRTVGEGTYSKVKVAMSELHQRDVAIKIIDFSKLPPNYQDRFLPREVDLLRCLRHENIVEVLQVMQGCHGHVFIVMELVECDLLQLMHQRSRLDQRTAYRIFSELCSAVRYLHENHVAHRDVKCENVLLTNELHVRLTDFGFSRQFRINQQSGCLEELSKTYCGSIAYASPEVLVGTPYDPRLLDVWSLGVVLFIMVTGRMPFHDSNLMQLLSQQKKGVTFNGTASPSSDTDARPLPPPLAPSGADGGDESGTGAARGSGSDLQVDTRCQDLIHKMLSFEPLSRLYIAQVFLHPWMSEASQEDSMLDEQL